MGGVALPTSKLAANAARHPVGGLTIGDLTAHCELKTIRGLRSNRALVPETVVLLSRRATPIIFSPNRRGPRPSRRSLGLGSYRDRPNCDFFQNRS